MRCSELALLTFVRKVFLRKFQVAADEFDLEIQRLICKSFIREVATEKKKLERKLIQQVSMNTHKIGVVVEAIQLNILPSFWILNYPENKDISCSPCWCINVSRFAFSHEKGSNFATRDYMGYFARHCNQSKTLCKVKTSRF